MHEDEARPMGPCTPRSPGDRVSEVAAEVERSLEVLTSAPILAPHWVVTFVENDGKKVDMIVTAVERDLSGRIIAQLQDFKSFKRERQL